MSETKTLEDRILAVLNNDPNSASSDEISALIADANNAIISAEQAIVAARELAQDITKTPLPVQAADARRAGEEAALTRDRLQGILPRLRERYTAALHVERRAKWAGFHEVVAAEREVLAQQFDQTLARVCAELGELNGKIKEHNAEVNYVNKLAREVNEWHEQLDPLPLFATVRTIDTDTGRNNEPDWRKANFAAANYVQPELRPNQYAFTSDWWKSDPVQVEAAKRDRERNAQFHKSQTEQSEKMFNDAERARFAAGRKAS